MKANIIASDIINGTIHFQDGDVEVSLMEWIAHPSFNGVYLKHIIQGSSTAGEFSAHLVKIEPNAALNFHAHDKQTELHQVIDGSGTCQMGSASFQYYPGKLCVIPKGEGHAVQADDSGLILLAEFFPALI